MALRRLLRRNQEEMVTAVRRQLSDLQTALARLQASDEDQATLRQSVRQLDELFLLVVVGEFNAGKSAFINALLGEKVLEEGVTPTTTRLQIVKYDPAVGTAAGDESPDVIAAPLELLREINIVDTPGTNALERRHEAITREFIPRADLVFFITSADRPFTESERAFLERIRQWGKKVVFVVNKIDILSGPEDTARIEAFIAENARRLLGISPEIFPVSARLALQGKQRGVHPELAKSRFEELERYIVNTLDEDERFRLKLLNPLRVALHMADKYAEVLEGRLELLKHDLATIDDIQNQLAVYREDMTRGFRLRLSDVANILLQFESRGNEFFDETIRLARVFDLMNKARIKSEFERKVIGEAPRSIERKVEEIIDWLISSDLQQWQAVRDHLARRRSEHADRIAGQMGGGFDYDRSRLLDTVGRSAQRTLESYDHEVEANRMAESVQTAVAGTALLEVGAVGLGTVVSLVASTTAADVTGLLAAGALAALGLVVIPYRRSAARKELREKLAALQEQLMSALNAQFDREIERSVRRLNDVIAPYTRFVRAERDSLAAKREELTRIRGEADRFRVQVETE